jgi:hypothetical protein
MQRSTSALRMIHGAPTQACVTGISFNRIRRKTVVGVTPRTSDASLTDISLRACRSPSPLTGIAWWLRREQIRFAVQVSPCLAGANLDNGDPETLLFSMTIFKFLRGYQGQAFLGGLSEKAS